jgi:hypothetical protein
MMHSSRCRREAVGPTLACPPSLVKGRSWVLRLSSFAGYFARRLWLGAVRPPNVAGYLQGQIRDVEYSLL